MVDVNASAFRLVSPNASPQELAIKPDYWRARVEALTDAHRTARAKRLLARGRERSAEASFVHEVIIEAERDELGLWPLAKFRALPGVGAMTAREPRTAPDVTWSEPRAWVLKILCAWDRQIQTASHGTRRLLRADREPTEHWKRRVLGEAERRIESQWHQTRAAGQRDRFRRVEKCATESRGVLVCKHCHEAVRDKDGRPKILRDLCGAHLLCARCRKLRGAKYYAKILRSRLAAVKAVRRARLGPGVALSDPLVERFLTLTCPHLPPDAELVIESDFTPRRLLGPEAQAFIVRRALRPFMNALRNHWRKRGALRLSLSRFVRVIEATEGADDNGHVHAHLWMLSPFVRVQVIRALWGRALLRAGFPLEHWPVCAWKEKKTLLAELELAGDHVAFEWAKKTLPARMPWPVVDLKRTYQRGDRLELETPAGRVDALAELVKYLCKDWETGRDGKKLLMHPALFAAVYRGLDEGRMISASRQFWTRHHTECACCGAIDTLRPVLELTPRPLARGPPLLRLMDPTKRTASV